MGNKISVTAPLTNIVHTVDHVIELMLELETLLLPLHELFLEPILLQFNSFNLLDKFSESLLVDFALGFLGLHALFQSLDSEVKFLVQELDLLALLGVLLALKQLIFGLL